MIDACVGDDGVVQRPRRGIVEARSSCNTAGRVTYTITLSRVQIVVTQPKLMNYEVEQEGLTLPSCAGPLARLEACTCTLTCRLVAVLE